MQKGYGDMVAAQHPGGAKSKYLCLVEMDLEDLPENAFVKDWAQTMLDFFNATGRRAWPQTLVPTYDVLTNSKVAFLARAASQNVFGSKAFAWIDGGLHWPMIAHLPQGDAVDILTCEDKLCIAFGFNPICWQK